MSTFVLCVGCGTPLYGFSPCQWCTCEVCGNDLRDGFCSLCNSRNSYVYDPNPNSFDYPPDSCHPPHPTYETYTCDSYGNDSHFGYDCQPHFPLSYESEPGYIKNYNSYPYDSSIFPQQELCCEDCGVLSEADTVNNPIFNFHNDFLHSQNELMEQMTSLTSMCEMAYQIIQKKQEEKRIEEEQSANAQYWKILACCDDDDDYNSAITPNEPVDSLSMGDEHLNTIDSLLDEFVGELTLLKLIPLGIDKTDCYHENEIRLTKRLLYDNSSPRPPKEFVSKNSYAEIESFYPSPIPVEDSDSFMEEIDLSRVLDDPMPPGIEDDDYDSERDILIHEELLDNYSLSLPVIESYHFDIPPFSRPPAKPPDGNTGILNIKMMGDVSDQKLSAKRPMMIHGKNIPILDVPLFHFYPPDQLNIHGNLKTLAKGFCPPSLHFLSFNWESSIQI
nr:pre-mRNA splicing Prp18-interacting factor [Tanacetum cinerariifolium]